MRFYIIGLSDHPQPALTYQTKELIANSRLFSGGERHYSIMRDQLPDDHQWILIKPPIQEVMASYEAQGDQPIVVFTSGDPLFYGFALTIQRYFPSATLNIYPSFNSIHALAHRYRLPTHRLTNVSVTGRSFSGLNEALIKQETLIGVLTDKNHTPSAIARHLLKYRFDNYTLIIGERLGNPDEKLRHLNLEEAAETTFDTLNTVILQQQYPQKRYFGIPDDQFTLLNGRSKMITKRSIRLMVLSYLQLQNRHIFWDIGTCTGSVAIEAKLQFPHLDIHTFEKKEEARQVFESNTFQLSAPGIDLHPDFFEAKLADIPSPDAVFIGGHGSMLDQMIQRAYKYMAGGGVMVFNAVKDASKKDFLASSEKYGFQDIQSVNITIEDHNPITLFLAIKKQS